MQVAECVRWVCVLAGGRGADLETIQEGCWYPW